MAYQRTGALVDKRRVGLVDKLGEEVVGVAEEERLVVAAILFKFGGGIAEEHHRVEPRAHERAQPHLWHRRHGRQSLVEGARHHRVGLGGVFRPGSFVGRLVAAHNRHYCIGEFLGTLPGGQARQHLQQICLHIFLGLERQHGARCLGHAAVSLLYLRRERVEEALEALRVGEVGIHLRAPLLVVLVDEVVDGVDQLAVEV